MTPGVGPNEARLVLELVGLPSLRLESAITRRVLGAIPPEHAGHRPAPGARSAAELARHIVVTELRFLQGAVGPGFPDSGELAGSAPPEAVLGFYETKFPYVLERLEALTGEALLREVDYQGLIRLPALGFVQLATHHTIHHRGQLSVYLREVGATVPPIYG